MGNGYHDATSLRIGGMDTHITGTGLAITPELRAQFDKQKHKLEKFVHNGSSRLDVELEHLTDRRTDDEFRAELMLRGGGFDVRSEARSMTLHGAIEEAVAQMQAELRKDKGKRRRFFKLEGLKFKNFLRFGRRQKL